MEDCCKIGFELAVVHLSLSLNQPSFDETDLARLVRA